MSKAILRQEAINDLSDIWDYTLHKWSMQQADHYYQDLKSACQEIGENQNIGKNYNEISKHIFGFKSQKHIVFYQKISEEEVEIIRILHERMDLKNIINE